MKNTKKIISVLLALIMLLGVMPMGVFTASAAIEGDYLYSINDKDEAKITGVSSDISGDIIIPETLGEKAVTSIDLYAFSEREGITSVTIPDCVTEISNGAFSNCTGLKTVKIGKGVVKFADAVFLGCSSLEKIEVSADNTVLTSDDDGVLYNKDKTELILYPAKSAASSYTVKDGVKVIKASAFMGSANLKTLIISDSVEEIGKNAFLGSVNLGTVVIGKSVFIIGEGAFKDCSKLTGINVSADNLTYSSDANYILYNKDKTMILKYPAGSTRSDFAVPSSVEEISSLSFEKVVAVEKITIPKSVKTIADSAFYGCVNITDVVYEGKQAEFKNIRIGENNEAILNARIEYSGEELHEHKYVESVKEANCTEDGVKTFTCSCGSTYTEKIPAKGHEFENNACKICKEKEFIYISDGTNAKITAYNGNAVNLIVPEKIDGKTVNAIGDNAFENHSEIVNISIPVTVKDVGSNAFYRTGYYNKVSNWDNGVLYIGSFLIEGQKSLKGNLTVKDGTTVIADYAFASVKNITSVTLPNSLLTIGDSAFSGCTAISSVETKDTEEEFKSVVIGSNNESLTQAEITFYVPPHYHAYVVTADVKATCTAAGYKTEKCACGDKKREDYPALGHDFKGNVCSRCEELEFKISMDGEGIVIKGCNSSLSGTLVIPEKISGYKVTAIDEKAFEGNKNITKVVLPATVEKIGMFAFAGSAISEIEVAAGNVKFSSENGILFNKDKTELVFFPARKATETTEIPVGVKKIADGALYGCDAIVTVRLPESLEEIGLNAFSNCSALKSVYFAGTQTQWKYMKLADGNEVIKDASFTFGNTSDTEAANALVADLVLENATAQVNGVEIIINATSPSVTFVSVANKTSSGKDVVIDCKGTDIVLGEGKYTLSMINWHKQGNKTVAQIETDKHTFTVQFVFNPANDGHDYSIKESVVANCVSDGCDRFTCSICGDSYDTNVIPKLGHKYGDWIVEKDESCKEDGIKYRICGVCDESTQGHRESGVIPKKDHAYSTVTVEATCTTVGYTTYTCTLCGVSFVGDEVLALGHKVDTWNVDKDATCTDAGTRNGVCTACSQTVKETVNALGHDYVKTVTPPAAGVQGYTRYSCTRCDYYYDSDFVAALSKIKSVSINSVVINREETAVLTPIVEAVGEVDYTVEYVVADESIVTVDENGKVTPKTKGITVVTCTLTDEDGKSYIATCTVEVKFTVLQWIKWFFVDVLLGLIISMFR